nr:flagellar hook-length control protein FliK [Anaerosalibacter bizertensis]
MLDEDSSEIRIKLKPEILGELLLKVEVEKGVVVAKAIVDNYRVKELIETNILQLKEGLEEQGLDIKTFQVQVGSNSDFDREQREEFFQNNRKNKRVKLKKESALNINNYEENIMSDNSISLNEGTLDLKA